MFLLFVLLKCSFFKIGYLNTISECISVAVKNVNICLEHVKIWPEMCIIFFKNSAKRICQFAEFQHFCNVEPHKLLRPAQTRWLSLLAVVQRILDQWRPLTLYFELTAFEQRLVSAEHILASLKNVHMKIFSQFLHFDLPKFVHLNQFFQSDKVVILQIQQKVIDCLKDILLCYMNRSYVLKY